MDNCSCCNGESYNYISYNNHKSTLKRTIRLLIRKILYLIIPSSFYNRIKSYLLNEALLGMWSAKKIKACNNCGFGKIDKFPNELKSGNKDTLVSTDIG